MGNFIRDCRVVGSGNNQGVIIRIFNHCVAGGNKVEADDLY